MKKFRFLGLLLIMLVTTFSFAACSDDDDGADVMDSSIVGNWRQVNSAGTTITITFNANKTGNIRYDYPNRPMPDNEGFEYDYYEQADGTRVVYIIGGQLTGTYQVVITNSRLYLLDGSSEYEFYRV